MVRTQMYIVQKGSEPNVFLLVYVNTHQPQTTYFCDIQTIFLSRAAVSLTTPNSRMYMYLRCCHILQPKYSMSDSNL